MADLYRSLWDSEAGHPQDSSGFGTACASLLPNGQTFDFILLWDLLNFLTQPQISALLKPLTGLCKNGTLVFAMISIRPHIAPRPACFHILELDRLRTEEASTRVRPSPQYKEPELLRLLPHFQVRRCFLMRHGVQEYLFEYRKPAANTVKESPVIP